MKLWILVIPIFVFIVCLLVIVVWYRKSKKTAIVTPPKPPTPPPSSIIPSDAISYPQDGLNSNSSDEYLVSASSNRSCPNTPTICGQIFYAFDKKSNTYWQCASGLYNDVSGMYTGTVKMIIDERDFQGEWIQVRIPQEIRPLFISIRCQQEWECTRNFSVLGTNDLNNWVLLFTNRSTSGKVDWSEEESEDNLIRLTPPSSLAMFRIFRLIIHRVGKLDVDSSQRQNVVSISDLNIIGLPPLTGTPTTGTPTTGTPTTGTPTTGTPTTGTPTTGTPTTGTPTTGTPTTGTPSVPTIQDPPANLKYTSIQRIPNYKNFNQWSSIENVHALRCAQSQVPAKIMNYPLTESQKNNTGERFGLIQRDESHDEVYTKSGCVGIFEVEPNGDKIFCHAEIGTGRVSYCAKDKEVFHITSPNKFSQNEARAVCNLYNADIATRNQLLVASKYGADWSAKGWTVVDDSLIPAQPCQVGRSKPSLRTDGESCVIGGDYRGGAGSTSLFPYYFETDQDRFGVNCYGVRPAQVDTSMGHRILPFGPYKRFMYDDTFWEAKDLEISQCYQQGGVWADEDYSLYPGCGTYWYYTRSDEDAKKKCCIPDNPKWVQGRSTTEVNWTGFSATPGECAEGLGVYTGGNNTMYPGCGDNSCCVADFL